MTEQGEVMRRVKELLAGSSPGEGPDPRDPVVIAGMVAEVRRLVAEQAAAQGVDLERRVESWWYLSFVDTDMSAPPELQVPGGDGFRGVCVVRGRTIMDAAQTAWKLGINPGGQIAGIPLEDHRVPVRWVNRLLTAVEVDQWDREQTQADESMQEDASE